MGLFDSLRRDKKVVPTVEPERKESTSETQSGDAGERADKSAPTTNQGADKVAPTGDERADKSAPTGERKSEVDVALEAEVIERDTSIPDVPKEEPPRIKSYKDKKPVTHAIGTTKIMAIINQKGGVGKSTTAINLSAALGELGKQILLVDLDPQGNTTSGLGIEKNQLNGCIYDVLLNDVPIEEVIIPDICEGLDLVPATINLAGAEVELVSEMARENRLKDAVGVMRGKYDYIFIDCPPSLGLLTVNSLVAADKLIIPIQTEFYALEGVTKLLESMKRVKNRLNPSLDIFGILLTMYDGRTTLSRQVAREVRDYFGPLVFETIIPRTVKLSEAPSYGIPITQYDPLGKGAKSYQELAKEVIQRG